MGEIRAGIYEQLVTRGLAEDLARIDPELLDFDDLDPADADVVLTRHLATLVRYALRSAPATDSDAGDPLARQVNLANRIAATILELAPHAASDGELVDRASVLAEVREPHRVGSPAATGVRPSISLSDSALLVNGRDQPRIGPELQKELSSADHVDLLCAFVKWHGVRLIEEQVAELLRRKGRAHDGRPTFRVITTTYVGATERRALDRLVELGAEVKISYETRMTRLHAKAWLFERGSTYSTAYVGSSNLSKSALVDGLEWNVRLSQVDQPHLLDTFRATFDEYWEDPAFEPYDPADEEQRARLDDALQAERGGPADLPIELASLDVRPWGYQQEILDELAAERQIHQHHRNLVVMATGTGKTVVAGLDYRRLRNAGEVESLLFIAHRDELLEQARRTFRHVVRDGSFGERLVGGERPTQWRHVFASVQSLARLDLADLDPTAFDMVIVDEFHHAGPETKTYARLLAHLQPRELLGLTATPERADGQRVTDWFDGRIAVELRLWEALERGLLAPFQYFGVHDGTDLASLPWRRGRYGEQELAALYAADEGRVLIILQTLLDKVTDVARMRALGFCVSIDHAEFMATRFNEAGIPAAAVTSRTPSEARRAALDRLRRRELVVLFTVDLFNEGVDLPEIDTVLFLRPTESATVVLQQLGRGLRLAEDKPCLTVLDFIGNQRKEFRFDLRYRALTGSTRKGLQRDVEAGFPTLPAGCHIGLDRVASEIVLSNIRASLRVDWKGLTSELHKLGDCDLSTFLAETNTELEDVYRRRKGGWAGLRRSAGLTDDDPGPDDHHLAGAIGRLLHIDDTERLEFLDGLLGTERPPDTTQMTARERRLLAMFHFSIWGWDRSLGHTEGDLHRLWANGGRLNELRELIPILRNRIRRVTTPEEPKGIRPLHLHARYSLWELLAGFGLPNPSTARGAGVRWLPDEQADVFWFNLRKTEKHFSPTTMYADKAISPTLFQWESQNATSSSSKTGQRYIRHQESGSTVHLFFRETKEPDGDLGVPPYIYAGPASYVSHTGDRPMRIIWRLHTPLPADVFQSARQMS